MFERQNAFDPKRFEAERIVIREEVKRFLPFRHISPSPPPWPPTKSVALPLPKLINKLAW